MKLPQRQQGGVQSLGTVPLKQQAAAGRASIGEAAAPDKVLKAAAEATTEFAELTLSRNFTRNTEEFSKYSDDLDTKAKNNPYTNVADLPQEIQNKIPNGSIQSRVDVDGNVIESSKVVPTVLIAAEHNAYLRKIQAKKMSKDIGSNVHAAAWLDKAESHISRKLLTDTTKKAAELKEIMRNEDTVLIDSKSEMGDTGGALASLELSRGIDFQDKAEYAERIKREGMSVNVDKLLLENDLQDMMTEYTRLSDEDNKDNGKQWDETTDTTTRIVQRDRLKQAVSAKVEGNRTALKKEYRGLQESIGQGYTDPDDPRFKLLGDILNLSSERAQSSELAHVRNNVATMPSAKFEEMEKYYEDSVKETMTGEDFIQGQKDLKNFSKIAAERKAAMVDNGKGDPTAFAIKYDETVKVKWNNFNRAISNPALGNPSPEGMMAAKQAQSSFKEFHDALAISLSPENLNYAGGTDQPLPFNSPIYRSIKKVIEEGTIGNKLASVEMLNTIFGDAAASVAMSVAEDYFPFYAAAAVFPVDPVAAEQILAGTGSINTWSDTELKDQYIDYVGERKISPSEASVWKAIGAHAAGKDTSNKKKLSSADFEESAKILIGEQMSGWGASQKPTTNYRKTNGAFNTEKEFNAKLKALTPTSIVMSGHGQPYINGQPVDIRSIIAAGDLIPDTNGSYTIEIPASSYLPRQAGASLATSGHVTGENGKPFVLNLIEVDKANEVLAFMDLDIEDSISLQKAYLRRERGKLDVLRGGGKTGKTEPEGTLLPTPQLVAESVEEYIPDEPAENNPNKGRPVLDSKTKIAKLQGKLKAVVSDMKSKGFTKAEINDMYDDLGLLDNGVKSEIDAAIEKEYKTDPKANLSVDEKADILLDSVIEQITPTKAEAPAKGKPISDTQALKEDEAMNAPRAAPAAQTTPIDGDSSGDNLPIVDPIGE